MKHKTDLVIVTNEPFPTGMAATNRILSYATEIAKIKKTKVFIVKPTENIDNILNIKPSGKIDSLSYEYTNKSTVWPFEKNKFQKFKLILIGLIGLIQRLFLYKPKTVVVYSSNVILRYVLIFMKPLLNYRFIIEENEYPKILNVSNNKIIQKLHFLPYKISDGMIVMTKELMNYYSKFNSKRIFHLPMTVDLNRFKIHCNKILNYDYFIYIGGSGGVKRDGIINMLNGFYYFQKEFNEYKLLIIGPLNEKDNHVKFLKEFIRNKKLTNKIIFKGVVPSKDIPRYLICAKGIIMTPQYNYQSGGFPTKLGEFLASGRPVITTDVSEIGHYLNNNNSYLLRPGNDLSISKALKDIVVNENNAKIIGMNGKKIAEHYFNINTYKDNLISFLLI